LRVMGSLIKDLLNARVVLNDEQQLLGVIRSLPDPEWSQMKLMMTHSENIKTFDNISCPLDLEVGALKQIDRWLLWPRPRGMRALGLNEKSKD